MLTLSKIGRGRRTLSASLSKWEGHFDRLECGQMRLFTGVKGRKFETSSTKDTRYSREKRSAFTRLKFQPDNLVIKGLNG